MFGIYKKKKKKKKNLFISISCVAPIVYSFWRYPGIFFFFFFFLYNERKGLENNVPRSFYEKKKSQWTGFYTATQESRIVTILITIIWIVNFTSRSYFYVLCYKEKRIYISLLLLW